MMSFLQHRSRRLGYCGWALRIKGADRPLEWTTCTTREEVRQLRDQEGWMRPDLEIVKVRISVEAVE
jgi:hypothetical protein